jgi:hypothetical protein
MCLTAVRVAAWAGLGVFWPSHCSFAWFRSPSLLVKMCRFLDSRRVHMVEWVSRVAVSNSQDGSHG